MKRCSTLLLGAALILGIAAFAPAPAQAQLDWCHNCEVNPSCFACCRCDGYTVGQCGAICGSPDDSAFGTQAAWMSNDEGDVPACAADEAPSCTADEAVSTDEAPSTAASR